MWLSPSSAIYWFCDLGQGTRPSQNSVLSSTRWGSAKTLILQNFSEFEISSYIWNIFVMLLNFTVLSLWSEAAYFQNCTKKDWKKGNLMGRCLIHQTGPQNHKPKVGLLLLVGLKFKPELRRVWGIIFLKRIVSPELGNRKSSVSQEERRHIRSVIKISPLPSNKQNKPWIVLVICPSENLDS